MLFRFLTAIFLVLCGTSVPAQDQVSIPWTVICEFENKIAENPSDKCRMAQSIVTAQSNDPVLIARVFQDPAPILLASVPLNVFLKPGLTLSIDNGRSETYAFEICNAEGCHTGIPLDNDNIAALKRGLYARFTFLDANGLEITLPVDLSGFTKSWNELTNAAKQ